MKTHTVITLGYECCPAFSTISGARKYLRELVVDSLERARRVSRTARKHRLGKDSYSITLGSDPRSTLYASHSIQTP